MLTDDQILRMMTPTPDLSALQATLSEAVQMDINGLGGLSSVNKICQAAAQVGDESVTHLILTHAKTFNVNEGLKIAIHLNLFMGLCRAERVDMINYALPFCCNKEIIIHGLIHAAQKGNIAIVEHLRPHVEAEHLIKILIQTIDVEKFDSNAFEIVYKGCSISDIRAVLSDIEGDPSAIKYMSAQGVNILKARAQIDFDREKLTDLVDTIKPDQNQKKPKNLL